MFKRADRSMHNNNRGAFFAIFRKSASKIAALKTILLSVMGTVVCVLTISGVCCCCRHKRRSGYEQITPNSIYLNTGVKKYSVNSPEWLK